MSRNQMYARTLYRYYSWQAATETFNYLRCLHHGPLWGPYSIRALKTDCLEKLP